MTEHSKQAESTFALRCVINGEAQTIETTASARLLTLIRDELELTGTKRSCDIGRCGACMVLMEGEAVNSCLAMAYQCAGKSITTIEGISKGGFDPIQQAFLEEGGFQCGYCTPGMIVSVKGLLDSNPSPSEDEIAEALSGNICRCTGYGGIRRAVTRAIEGRMLAK
ncbi:carbon-monoxide dehydrogenase small subunit [Paenibacillus endophyticus]|uniref:Carbon-monoxide dehydrogenase small subunit n=1 Tax=Paenibacillus endophyticus TaxID=1294268 RepID=A0A7W5C6S3_9BACL|nr:(2Fe-2S)-binding protein [Paenibacillus endophyticus]MBB3151957.1 carbon-monoxide dehydrogenase small subunit [Paenibacillus endophyticus]